MTRITIETTEEQNKALEIMETTLEIEVNKILRRIVSNAKEEFKQQFVEGKTLMELEGIKQSINTIVANNDIIN